MSSKGPAVLSKNGQTLAATFGSPESGRSLSKRLEQGKALRQKVPRQSHAAWKPSVHRRDPVSILIESTAGRIPELIPIRYGRMIQSPFTFFRGAAALMAADLAKTPKTGIFTQLCGDCHLLNFGAFATPERRFSFDINDFDETLPGPWEWDFKRLVTSFIIASRNNRFSKSQGRASALACARSYRKHLAEFSEMRTLQVWYARIDNEAYRTTLPNKVAIAGVRKRLQKVLSRDVMEEDFPKLAEANGKKPRIRDNPPLIYHSQRSQEKGFQDLVMEAFLQYRASLRGEQRALLDRYVMKDIAMKVVGVGSVGTRCGIMLLMAYDEDPLFLQVKEARVSVLEPYLQRTIYQNQGQRVVEGQRLMQSASDIFLGWTEGKKGLQFYVRQLRDIKIKPQVEVYQPDRMEGYAKACGWALARAHAKAGDAALISGYIGKSENFDEAMADFGEAYADQNERDHEALLRAVRSGRIEAYLER